MEYIIQAWIHNITKWNVSVVTYESGQPSRKIPTQTMLCI